MRYQELLTEASSVLYHYTHIPGALNILRSGKFQLSSTTGNPSERSYQPQGYPYFLSTTRSKVGDYHRYTGISGVMLVLDGAALSTRYPIKPIDYWERSWLHSPGRSREAEDRVFSNSSTIPIKYLREIHILLKEQDDSRNRSAGARRILLLAKKRGIPAYFYTDEAAWRLQDRRRAVPPSKARDMLRGAERIGTYVNLPRGIPGHRRRSDILNWIELIKKPRDQELSAEARKLLYNIRYAYDRSNMGSLENDLFNAKKPGDREYPLAVRLTDYMNRNNMELRDLMAMLTAKWADAKAS